MHFYRKVKQYFWPPIPNPEKVLQGYLTEINTQKRVSYLTALQVLSSLFSWKNGLETDIMWDHKTPAGPPIEKNSNYLLEYSDLYFIWFWKISTV